MSEFFYITTAIDYTNGKPHIGHAYEKVLTDVIARFQRLCGREVCFLTGVDQHGQKVQQTAEAEGVEPKAYVDGVTEKFLALWKRLGVEYDVWAATTEDSHKEVVRATLQKLFDDGQIYKDKHQGFYSVRQEQFLTDKERGEDGAFGEEWGEVVEIEEENYYFKLSEHVEWLKAFLEKRADFIYPEFRKHDVLNALENTTGDLCISRPKKRLSWGIELPFDEEYVTFVWFDALLNYVSFVGYHPSGGTEGFKEKWPAVAHVLGKDILVPSHSIYWPIMLHAMGFADEEISPLLVHGWWNIKGDKMSKSLGNVVDPNDLADRVTEEGLRYYLMKDIHTGYDADFSEERIIQAYQKELAGGLGNLLNRTLGMAGKYRDGKLALKAGEAGEAGGAEASQALLKQWELSGKGWREKMASYEVSKALEAVWELVSLCNQYVDQMAPWTLAKQEKESGEPSAALDEVLGHLAESLVHFSVWLQPVLPEACAKIRQQLQWELPEGSLHELSWGQLPDGHVLGKPEPIFPRLELEASKEA